MAQWVEGGGLQTVIFLLLCSSIRFTAEETHGNLQSL